MIAFGEVPALEPPHLGGPKHPPGREFGNYQEVGRVRVFGEVRGVKRLREPHWACDEIEGYWRLMHCDVDKPHLVLYANGLRERDEKP